MEGLSRRLEDALHSKLNRVMFEKEGSLQGFVNRILEVDIEETESKPRQEMERK